MATKLEKLTFPSGHTADDFKAFGPPATKDGEFTGTKICDLGCFTQDGKDSNKYYMGMVAQSKKDGKWYAYFEWGRTGATKPQFQFVLCSSEKEAEIEYANQLHEKNDKRGEWVNHPSLGRILRAKVGKDCYLVRPQATRSTGLPDAKTIILNEGAKIVKTANKKASNYDPQTLSLLKDLVGGTLSYTRSALVAGAALPTQKAIDDSRILLTDAQKRVLFVGDNIKDQVSDKDLLDITSQLYGRIPKLKARNASPETWILTKDNIFSWQQDLDAFESALHSTDLGDTDDFDPFRDAPTNVKLSYLDKNSEIGKFIYNWWPKATANKHGGIRDMKIHNLWKIDRDGDIQKLNNTQNNILKEIKDNIDDRPLFQPEKRIDLNESEIKVYKNTNTALLFHGTKSVCVSGILREGLRSPKELTGVAITGAMWGVSVGYFADDFKKSAGYCSMQQALWSGGSGAINGRKAFMFAADIICGKPFVPISPRGFKGPPDGHHCIFAKGRNHYGRDSSGVENNEWVIFNRNQINLRYLVEFSV